jgi:hypothetical protein
MEKETRSERAKRLRSEGKFLPKNPGRPRGETDPVAIQRTALLEIVQSGTPTQRLDASKHSQSSIRNRPASDAISRA